MSPRGAAGASPRPNRSGRRKAQRTGKRSKGTGQRNGGFWFDEEAADRAVEFFPRFLRHAKGQWAGKPFELEPWQIEVVRNLFGWKRADGTRKYRQCLIAVPRKNGKSTFAAGLALYLLLCDREPGAEVYSAAADREQAAIVFDLARFMVEQHPALAKRARPFRRTIVAESGASSYKVLSADVGTKHGLNAHGIIFDELHAQPHRHLWDVLNTSVGARQQPLSIAITTAGDDQHSICYEVWEYARRVRDGVVDDPAFLPVLFETGEDEDWTDPEVWAKANPSLGRTVTAEFLEAECKKALETPAYENTFRRLYLNQWVRQAKRWMPLRRWDECAAPPAELAGRRVYGGLDLSSNTDVTALVWVAEADGEGEGGRPLYDIVPRLFIPAESMRERVRRDRVPYDVWQRQGLLEVTTGDVVDYDHVLHRIREDAAGFHCQEIAFDRWGSIPVTTKLQDDGFEVVQFGQGFASMSSPTKELLKLVLGGQLRHGGHPVLRWMADNMVVREDPAGNIKPDKARCREKIDGVVALIMALARALLRAENRSPYEQRGVREV